MSALDAAAERLAAMASTGAPTFKLYVEGRWVHAALVNAKGERVATLHAAFSNERTTRAYVTRLYPAARFT